MPHHGDDVGAEDSAVTGLTQMGGEGSQWIGQAPFTDVPHLFQNIGDGTFFHSGQLAVQACVAAGVNITYKLLYNEVVAMTGAQDAEGALTVAKLTHKLTAEGVKQIIICADEPQRHDKRALAKGTILWHRDRLDEAQKTTARGRRRDRPDLRPALRGRRARQRKRGTLPTRTTRVLINEAVCEGCGDCGVKSNCLSVQPVDTEFGRKTRIDQTSCNTDYSCLDGDCPSFVTVEVQPGKKARARSRVGPRSLRSLPDLDVEPVIVHPQRLLRRHRRHRHRHGEPGARHRGAARRLRRREPGSDRAESEGRTGRVAPEIRRRQARPVQPAHPRQRGLHRRFRPAGCRRRQEPRLRRPGQDDLRSYRPARRRPATWCTTSRSPTPRRPTCSIVSARCPVGVHSFDALAAAQKLFGSTAAANFLLVGAAYQTGALRLPAASIEEAIGVNGVAVDANIAAFRWGRVAIADPARFDEVAAPARDRQPPTAPARVPAGTRSRGRSATWSPGGRRTWSSSRARRSPIDTCNCCRRSGLQSVR